MQVKTSKKAFWAVILCIPIAVIVYFAVTSSPENIINPSEIITLSLQTPSGEFDAQNAEDIAFYADLISNVTLITQPLRELTDDQAIDLVCQTKDGEVVYTLYPELSVTGCMLTIGDAIYLVDEQNAATLLMREEFGYLYEVYRVPALKLSTGDLTYNINPAEFEWQYRKIDDLFYDYTTQITVEEAIYSMYSNRTNGAGFDITPDFMTIEFTDAQGEILLYNSFDEIILPTERILKASVVAEWSKKPNTAFCGKASYEISFLYDIPATLTFSQNAVFAGGFVTINATQLHESEQIGVSNEAFEQVLIFSESSGAKTAAFAVPSDLESGDYSIKFKIGDNFQTLSLNVTAMEDGDFERYSVDSQRYNQHLSDEAIEEFYALANTLTKGSSGELYTDPLGSFRAPTDNGELVVKFGDEIMLNLDGGIDSRTFTANCQVYLMSDGGKLRAVKKGIIVFADEIAAFGNTIVIDHGCGMLTWYTGIEQITRSVGDVVNANDLLGSVSSGLIVDEPYSLFIVTVGGIPTNQSY